MTPRFDVVGLVVGDMAASIGFYRGLGLEFPEGAEAEGHVEASLPGGLRLNLDSEEVMRSFSNWQSPAPGGGHRVSLAFLCDSPAEVDSLYGKLVESGAPSHLEPFDAFWGQHYATVLDPDGNPVDLFAALPAEA